MIYQNKPCLPYFSSVVKNVANPNIEVKKLVYIYLLHYAESDPDLALLSVNAIQKSLSDQNPQVRAMALRTMSGMRVPVISQIVSLAIKKGVGDMSPHVRKAAALAIPKCYALDPSSLPQLLDYISTLLGDKQYFVVGPAVQTFLDVCPERIDLIHKHYRGLVRKLVDMDDWGQLATLRLLLFYSRKCFPRRSQKVTKMNKKGFYDDEEDESVETGETALIIDPDLELFLKACRSLLSSRNPAIIVAVANCYLHLGTKEHTREAIGPLVALMRGPPETQEVALCNIVSVALDHPDLFAQYTSHFLLSTEDTAQIWRFKIEMLTLIFPHAQSHLKSIILSELEHFSHSSDTNQIQESVRAIGRCAQSDLKTSSRCFKVLLNQISSFDNTLVSEVLTVMRHLIQQDPTSHKKTIIRLARNLDRTTSPAARATIIWLVGEFAGIDPNNNIAADVLRILVKDFASESEEAKHQIVLLAAKVYLYFLQAQSSTSSETTDEQYEDTSQSSSNNNNNTTSTVDLNHPIPRIWTYTLLLCRYDTSYDLRDRARLFKSLLQNPTSIQLASLILLAPKPVPHAPSPSETRKGLMLGSATLVLGRDIAGLNGLPGYEDIPSWVEEGREPDPRLRDGDGTEKEEYVSLAKREVSTAASKRLEEAVREQGLEGVVNRGVGSGAGMKGMGKSGGGGKKSLDAWLDEEEDEEDDDDEEGETETESEETDEESSSGEEEETDEEESDDGADIRRREKRGLMT